MIASIGGCKSRQVAMALVVAALPFAYLDAPAASCAEHHAHAEPQRRVADARPSIRTVAPRIDPNIAGRVTRDRASPASRRVGDASSAVNPSRRCPMRAIRRTCSEPANLPIAAASGECRGKPAVIRRWRRRQSRSARRARATPVQRSASLASSTCRPVPPIELVAEIDGALTDAQVDELARRHGLVAR